MGLATKLAEKVERNNIFIIKLIIKTFKKSFNSLQKLPDAQFVLDVHQEHPIDSLFNSLRFHENKTFFLKESEHEIVESLCSRSVRLQVNLQVQLTNRDFLPIQFFSPMQLIQQLDYPTSDIDPREVDSLQNMNSKCALMRKST